MSLRHFVLRNARILVLDRYLFGQLVQLSAMGLLLFTIIWLAPETMFRVVQWVFDKKLTLPEAFRLLGLYLPGTFLQALPMTALFSGMMLFRRLSLDYELIAMNSHGIGMGAVFRPVLLAGLLLSVAFYGVQEGWAPQASPALEQLLLSKGLKEAPDNYFTYVERDQQQQLKTFLLIGQTQNTLPANNVYQDIVVLHYRKGTDGARYLSRLYRAKQGQWIANVQQWRLSSGTVYTLDENGVYQDLTSFEQKMLKTSSYPYELLKYSAQRPADMNSKGLSHYIDLLKAGGQLQDVPFFEVRLAQKQVAVWVPFVFLLLGAVLGIERLRSQRHVSLALGAVILFCYSILVPFSANLGSLGVLPVWFTAWLPLGLVGLIALVLLFAKRQFQL